MIVTTNIFLDEKDIKKIVRSYLEKEGYGVNEIEINVKSEKDIPEGAVKGDSIGINVKARNPT